MTSAGRSEGGARPTLGPAGANGARGKRVGEIFFRGREDAAGSIVPVTLSLPATARSGLGDPAVVACHLGIDTEGEGRDEVESLVDGETAAIPGAARARAGVSVVGMRTLRL
jgi:hypothetical protein